MPAIADVGVGEGAARPPARAVGLRGCGGEVDASLGCASPTGEAFTLPRKRFFTVNCDHTMDGLQTTRYASPLYAIPAH